MMTIVVFLMFYALIPKKNIFFLSWWNWVENHFKEFLEILAVGMEHLACFVACYCIWLVSAGCGTRRLNGRIRLSAHHSICISCLICSHEFYSEGKRQCDCYDKTSLSLSSDRKKMWSLTGGRMQKIACGPLFTPLIAQIYSYKVLQDRKTMQ